jgi:hypothetical protein
MTEKLGNPHKDKLTALCLEWIRDSGWRTRSFEGYSEFLTEKQVTGISVPEFEQALNVCLLKGKTALMREIWGIKQPEAQPAELPQEQVSEDSIIRYGTDGDLSLSEVKSIVKQCNAFVKQNGKVTEFVKMHSNAKYEVGTLRKWRTDPKFTD